MTGRLDGKIEVGPPRALELEPLDELELADELLDSRDDTSGSASVTLEK
ncbi:hypothetical protein [Desulfosarcina ovata]|nr:hypothetical protein [Desulfosarcina ovata]